MKSSMKSAVSARLIGRGILGGLFLAACVVWADPTTPSSQGAGARQLTGSSAKMTGGDAASFIRKAAEGNDAEVALAEVAERKSQNQDVKQFAQMIRDDHRQANEKLKPIAQAHGITLSQQLSSKEQKRLQRLEQLSGSEFDKQYMEDMLKDHQHDISEFQKASTQVQESDVKQYAQETLPKLREHLQHARHTAQTVGVDPSTISSILKSGSMGGTGESSEKESGTSSGK